MTATYLAGRMRHVPYFNFPEFDRFAAKLRAEGETVFSPAEHDREELGLNPDDFPTGDFADQGWTPEMIDTFMRKAIAWDMWAICQCDRFAILPGSENSSGTHAELATAKLLGLRIIYLGRNE